MSRSTNRTLSSRKSDILTRWPPRTRRSPSIMPIACPNCASRNLRYSLLRTLPERWWSLLGIRPLRCRDCRYRFVARTWRLSNLQYARCPECWRTDLSLWSEKDCHITPFMALRMSLGAKPFRCEYCRVNFLSFRRRHEKFTFKRWARKRKSAEHQPAAEEQTQSKA